MLLHLICCIYYNDVYITITAYLLFPYLTDLTDLYTFGQTQVMTLAGVLGSHNNSSYTHQLFPLFLLINFL